MEKKNNKLTSNLWVKDGLDVPFLCIMLVLMAFGLIMLLSASYAYSYYETDGDSSLHFFFRQLIFMGGGSVVVGIVSHIDYKKYVYLSNFALLVACVLVAITIMIGKKEGGEINRWLSFGFFDIQPSEIAKFAIVVFFFAGLVKNLKKMISSMPSKNIVAQ